MKELQNYQATVIYPYGKVHTTYPNIYLASEADAAFAEMRREHVQALIEQRDTDSGRLHKIFDAEIERLKQHHAEEIERLKAQLLEYGSALIEARMHSVSPYKLAELNIQAERYEKLRRLSAGDFASIRRDSIRANRPMYEAFDALVDQLPASGEESKS